MLCQKCARLGEWLMCVPQVKLHTGDVDYIPRLRLIPRGKLKYDLLVCERQMSWFLFVKSRMLQFVRHCNLANMLQRRNLNCDTDACNM